MKRRMKGQWTSTLMSSNGGFKKKVLLKTDRQVKDLKKSTPPYLIQVKNVQNFNLGLVIVDRL